MANAKPGCPYAGTDEMVELLESKFGIEVVKGTHDYH
jgi:predicted metal-binding protein